MHTLVFKQKNNNQHGSCDCILNGKRVDGCDMNYDQKYTQAHVVLASAIHTLNTDDIEVTIEAGHGSPEVYPIQKIKDMAPHVSYVAQEQIRTYETD